MIDIKGKLVKLFDTKQVSERFSKREFVVETGDNPKYPQHVLFQITGEKISQLDKAKPGDEVALSFEVRGREWTSPQNEVKYFNSLDVWKVSVTKSADDVPF